MIVSLQNPVIQNRNTRENNLEQKLSINKRTNLNQDSFTSRKTNDNIAFGRFLGFLKKPPITPVKEVAEKVFSPEAQRLMQINVRDGGTVFHTILDKFDLENVKSFIKNLQKNPVEFAQIAAIRTEFHSNSNINRTLPYDSSAVDIITKRAGKSSSELKEWDKLAASVIRSLKDFPEALNENLCIKQRENTLKKAIVGLKTQEDFVLMEEIIKSIVDVTKNNTDLYADMLIHNQKDGYLYYGSAIKETFNLNEQKIDFIIDSLKGDKKNLFKVFQQAAFDCDDLNLANKMTNYFQNKSETLGLDRQTVTELNINTIYNALNTNYISSKKNEPSKWDTLSENTKKQIISLVEDLIQNPDIEDIAKLKLIYIFPEQTSVMQKKFIDLCKIPETPIA